MKRIFFIIFIGVVISLAYFNRAEIKLFFYGNLKTVNLTEVRLLITEDLSPDSLAAFLVSKGVLSNKKEFLKEVEEQGLTEEAFDAGKYAILTGTKISNLVDGFSRGENGHGKAELKVRVIFNRSETIEDIGMNISKCIMADSVSIVKFIQSPQTLSKYGFTIQQIPALFIPDEYEMYYDTDAGEFVEFMAEQFRNYWTEERKDKIKAVGLNSPSQVATLASIVYSEQGKVPAEWPVIAKLYLNRLAMGMKLQSDPTFKFCWGDKLSNTQRLTGAHRNIDCEYNTYKINGLPPGPICIVPIKVIEAVLNPDTNNYLFMCAKPNYTGEHDFTRSDVEHVRNAAIYHKWLSSEGKN